MKWNLKEIMAYAWKLIRKEGKTRSEAMKAAWARAKHFATGVNIQIADWFCQKNFGRSAYCFENNYVVAETDKAFKIHNCVECFVRDFWVPKSVCC